jgi:hypothetical protein
MGLILIQKGILTDLLLIYHFHNLTPTTPRPNCHKYAVLLTYFFKHQPFLFEPKFMLHKLNNPTCPIQPVLLKEGISPTA